MLDNFSLSQILGTLATILLIISLQFPKRSHLLILQFISSLLWILHYALFDAWSATFGLIIEQVMIMVYFFPRFRANKIIFSLFVLATFAVLYFTWQDWTSSLGIIATLAYLCGLTTILDSRLRLYLFVESLAFLTLALVLLSPIAIATELFYLSSACIAIYRFDLRKQITK